MARLLVICNPTAGRMRGRALWPRISEALKAAGVMFEVVFTQRPLHALEIAQTTSTQYDGVVAVGGDGTVSEVVNGLMLRSAQAQTLPLGLIPVGNGDDFVKVLPPQATIGGASYDWRLAVQKIAAGRTRLYDVGRMQVGEAALASEGPCRYFINIVDVGFGAHTVKNFASVPWFLSGYPAYLAAVFKTMVDYPALRLRIQIGDAPAFEQVTTITAIGNGRCFGGGFWVCPSALPDDGLLDVMVSEQISRATILRLLPKLQRGTHVDQPVVKMARARSVVLESDQPFLVEADGEMPVAPTKRLKLDLVAGRLRLFV